MNQNAIINRLAKITGCTRKQVIDTLKKMSSIPEVRRELEKQSHDQKRGKKAS